MITNKQSAALLGKENAWGAGWVRLIKSLIDEWERRPTWGAFVKDQSKVDWICKLINVFHKIT